MLDDCAPHDEDFVVSASSLDQLDVSQLVGADESKDDVWCMLLLDEDGGVLGSYLLYDPSSINRVRCVLDCACGHRKDAVLPPPPGALRLAYWCPDCGVPHPLAI